MAGSSFHFNNRLYSSETFATSGTFFVPSGVNLVWVEMYGGGGGGLGRQGGGAGERIHAHIPVTPGSSVQINIGQGGAADLDGGATTFGAFKSRGGQAGGSFSSNKTGLDSFRATGGAAGVTGSSGEVGGGGDAGFGNGGSGGSDAQQAGGDGGIGAGGGGGLEIAGNNTAARGSGGDGICIVHYILA